MLKNMILFKYYLSSFTLTEAADSDISSFDEMEVPAAEAFEGINIMPEEDADRD